MNLDHLTKQPLAPFSGFDLAIGSVFALRWFAVDTAGRLRGVSYAAIWKPGENIAKCRAEETSVWSGSLFATPLMSYYSSIFSSTAQTPSIQTPPLSEAAVEAKVEVEHLVPTPSCGCGFWAYAHGCLEDTHKPQGDYAVGVVECYGKTILGTKGLRAEKARIRALATDRKDVQRLYPDVKFYRSANRMERRFDIVQPAELSPETDPTFWGDTA